jgi:hypothetical protein
MRRRGPGLLRTVARTAVISSTATASSRAMNNAIDQKAIKARQEQASALQTQQEMEQMKAQLMTMQATPTSSTQTASSDLLTQLTQLSQLKDAGALTEEEFQLAKAKLLS